MDEKIKARIENRRKSQKEWRSEAIDLAIEAINGATHREKEMHIKRLLLCLKNMPEIQEWDYGEETDDIPF